MDQVKDFLEEFLGWVLHVFGEGSQELDFLSTAQFVPVGGYQLGGLENSWVGSSNDQSLEVKVESNLPGDLVGDLINLLLALLDDSAGSKTEELDGSGHLVHEKTGVHWGGNGVSSTEGGGSILKKISIQLWDLLGSDWGQKEFMKTGFVQLGLWKHLLSSVHMFTRVVRGALLVTGSLLLLGLLGLLACMTVVDGLAELDLSLHLRPLLFHTVLVAGLLNFMGGLEMGTSFLSIANRDQVKGLAGNSLDLGIAINTQLNLLLDFSTEDEQVIGINTTGKVADLGITLVEWAEVVKTVGRLDSGEFAEGSISGEFDILHDFDNWLSITELLLHLLGGTVGDGKGTERVLLPLFLR